MSSNEKAYTLHSGKRIYSHCEDCGSKSLISCNCMPVNYSCTNCEWRYITHSHATPPSIPISLQKCFFCDAFITENVSYVCMRCGRKACERCLHNEDKYNEHCKTFGVFAICQYTTISSGN